MVDGRRVGLPDARVSHGVRPNCVWDFVCARDPCVPGARCRQQGLSSFRCQCDQDMCVKADYADTYKVRRSPGPLGVVTEVIPSLPMYSEFVEGVFSGISDPGCGTGRAERRASHRRRERSHHHGQHPNRPRLREVRRPRCWRASSRRGNSCTRATRSRCVATGRRSNKPGAVSICGIHGNMVHFSWCGQGEGQLLQFFLRILVKFQEFSWYDFLQVRYYHDGSESTRDAILLEVEFATGPDYVQSLYLQGPHRFALPVNVTPANDPPSLTIPPGKKLRLAQVRRTMCLWLFSARILS